MNFDLNEEQKVWKKIVHDFVEKEIKPKAREVDENEEFNWEAVRKGGPVGLMGMSIPEEYGGSNVDAISNDCDGGTWAGAAVPPRWRLPRTTGLAPRHRPYGSEELKKKWLPLVRQRAEQTRRAGADRTRRRFGPARRRNHQSRKRW
jgi:alkylation response protein AidB-like acyl-CoA dehydrogenase